MAAASAALKSGDLPAAISSASDAFRLARRQRSHQLVSDAWMFMLDTYATEPDAVLLPAYREGVEGAFAWAETMPEEIQIWFFPALTPHLERLGLRRLVDRSARRAESAARWSDKGNANVRTRVQQHHLEDVRNGKPVDARAVALERMAAFYADEMLDPEHALLRDAAARWREVGRDDRADFLEELAARDGSQSP